MTTIELDVKKSVAENAQTYFEKAKKARKKAAGAKIALENAYKKFEAAEEEETEKEVVQKPKRKQKWYEKFRWFISSEGFLCIGGRDATTNEIVVKKHAEKDDVIFHTDMAGSPFFIIKTEGKKPGPKTLQEVANATFTYSRAFKMGLYTANVFWVLPEQVTKEALAGEFLPKGAFMIRGKTNYISPKIDIAIGIMKDDAIMGGPVEAVKKNCEEFVILEPGKDKTSALAKKIKVKIGGELDDIIKVIPAGGAKLKK